MKKAFISFLIFSSFFLFKTGILAQEISYSDEVNKKIQAVENNLMGWVLTQDFIKWNLKDRMALYKIYGLSVAVVSNYKIEWAKGYGWADTSEHRKVTTQTLFQAASLSKSLNAVGILKLVQDKKLDLNTDINQYLKTWKFPYDSVAKNKKITVKNLLSHTAGLTIHGFPGYSIGDTIPSLVQILNGTKPANTQGVRSEFEPGLKFQYSGGGTTISQLILTDIIGKPYDKFMWENVLKPLGMKNSFYTQPPPANKNKLLATAYYSDGNEVKGKFHVYPEQAAAGLWTNPTDLCKYIVETQLSYQGKSNKVLSTEMTKLRLTPFIDEAAALGVFVETRGNSKYFQHSGGNEGFACQYYGSLENGNGVVIMLNTENGAINEEIANSVAIVYKWKDFYNPVVKNVISVSDSVLNACVGKYKLNGEEFSIIRKDNDLYIDFRGMLWKIFFTSNLDFFVMEVKGDLKFAANTQGKISGFEISGDTKAEKIE